MPGRFSWARPASKYGMGWKIRLSHSGELIWLTLGRRCRRGGESGVAPGAEAAQYVPGTFEAEIDQGGGGEDGRAAVVTDHHDLIAQAASVGVAPGAVGVEPPLEHRARDVERAGNDAVALAVDIGANVDEKGAPFDRRQRFTRFEPFDPRLRGFDQLFERSPVSADNHMRIIHWPLGPV